MRLENKNAIITGAGSGIGRATAMRFAQEGATVICADINKSAVEQTVGLIKEQDGKASAISFDVTNSAEIESAVEKVLSEYSEIDILVNNAGVTITGSIIDLSEAQWDKEFDVNVKSIYLVSKALWPHFLAKKNGVILNTASIAGLTAIQADAAYCASKGGVILLTKSMAIDGAQHGIRVNCVCPGFIDTPMIQGFFNDQQNPVEARNYATKLHPLGRLGDPTDIANGYVYLASNDATWVTGTALTIDGGLTCALPPS